MNDAGDRKDNGRRLSVAVWRYPGDTDTHPQRYGIQREIKSRFNGQNFHAMAAPLMRRKGEGRVLTFFLFSSPSFILRF